MRDIEKSQRGAIPEQHAHIRHLRGLEVFQSFDAFKGLEVLKPSCRGGRTKFTERSIKDSSENGGIGRCKSTFPSRD